MGGLDWWSYLWVVRTLCNGFAVWKADTECQVEMQLLRVTCLVSADEMGMFELLIPV